MNIDLKHSDFIAALELEREVVRRRDELGVAQNAMARFVAHMRAIYHVPADYVLTDWLRGFEPPEVEDDDGRQDD